MGGLLLPMLVKARYPEQFSIGLINASGSLGLLFPPSLPLFSMAFIPRPPLSACSSPACCRDCDGRDGLGGEFFREYGMGLSAHFSSLKRGGPCGKRSGNWCCR